MRAMRYAGARSMRVPKAVIVPCSARTTPEIVRNVVLLPAPLGPRSATTEPSGTRSDTSRSATTPP